MPSADLHKVTHLLTLQRRAAVLCGLASLAAIAAAALMFVNA